MLKAEVLAEMEEERSREAGFTLSSRLGQSPGAEAPLCLCGSLGLAGAQAGDSRALLLALAHALSVAVASSLHYS